MTILEEMNQFSARFQKTVLVNQSAENDPTQSHKDLPRYEKLFGRAVEVVDMGIMGHTAALFDPDKYVELLESALA